MVFNRQRKTRGRRGCLPIRGPLHLLPSAELSKPFPGLEDNQRVLEFRTRYASASRASSLLPPPCQPVFLSGHRPASRRSLFDFCRPPSFCFCNILVSLETPKARPSAPQPTPTNKTRASELNHVHMEIDTATLSHQTAGTVGATFLAAYAGGLLGVGCICIASSQSGPSRRAAVVQSDRGEVQMARTVILLLKCSPI